MLRKPKSPLIYLHTLSSFPTNTFFNIFFCTPLFCFISNIYKYTHLFVCIFYYKQQRNTTTHHHTNLCHPENPISPKQLQLHLVEDSSKGFLKMVELKKILSRKNSKAFVVKMRIFHKRSQSEKANSMFWYRYFKWLLWFSLSSYFFVSFLITHSPNPIKPTSFPLSKPSFSRALIESQNPITHSGLLNGMKVYVYNLPPKYNNDWLKNPRCKNHLFASEVAIHKALLTSQFRTLDPTEADFFFVPVYVSCNFSTVNGFPAIGHARALISSAVQLVSSEYPFWNRSRGSDHVFVASHDYGACFHAMEDVAMADGIPEFMQNSVILQTFGVKYKHPCQEVENVVMPPYISPGNVKSTLAKSPVNGRRDIFAFFRGKMEVHPKNISGRFYSKKVRTEILRKYGSDRRFYLKRHRFAGYQSEIVRSVFCLCPLGWAPWSPRLVESVALGCVPVIIADGIQLPFESAVNWPEISLTVPERDVGKLGDILEHVTKTNLTIIQRNLWDTETRRALLYSDPMEEGDATWQVLNELSLRLTRSHKSVSSE